MHYNARFCIEGFIWIEFFIRFMLLLFRNLCKVQCFQWRLTKFISFCSLKLLVDFSMYPTAWATTVMASVVVSDISWLWKLTQLISQVEPCILIVIEISIQLFSRNMRWAYIMWQVILPFKHVYDDQRFRITRENCPYSAVVKRVHGPDIFMVNRDGDWPNQNAFMIFNSSGRSPWMTLNYLQSTKIGNWELVDPRRFKFIAFFCLYSEGKFKIPRISGIYWRSFLESVLLITSGYCVQSHLCNKNIRVWPSPQIGKKKLSLIRENRIGSNSGSHPIFSLVLTMYSFRFLMRDGVTI